MTAMMSAMIAIVRVFIWASDGVMEPGTVWGSSRWLSSLPNAPRA
jgi:hypothetical protein